MNTITISLFPGLKNELRGHSLIATIWDTYRPDNLKKDTRRKLSRDTKLPIYFAGLLQVVTVKENLQSSDGKCSLTWLPTKWTYVYYKWFSCNVASRWHINVHELPWRGRHRIFHDHVQQHPGRQLWSSLEQDNTMGWREKTPEDVQSVLFYQLLLIVLENWSSVVLLFRHVMKWLTMEVWVD